MGQQTMAQLTEILDAYVQRDTDLAVAIWRRDAELDETYNAIFREVVTYMMEDPRNVSHALDMSWCARSLERIADHACNICEYVVYLVEGKDIRHANLDEMRKKLL